MLAAFASALHALQPAVCPGFAFAWLELVSHRSFMPNLLLAKQNKGWSLMHRLLVDLLIFMEPHLRRCVGVWGGIFLAGRGRRMSEGGQSFLFGGVEGFVVLVCSRFPVFG